MTNHIVGVFGANNELKSRFLDSIATKNDAGGNVLVYQRRDRADSTYFLDGLDFPEKIQGYSLVTSLCDHSYFIFPGSPQLQAPDGELALLVESFRMPGHVEIVDSPGVGPTDVFIAFKKFALLSHTVEMRSSASSGIDLSWLDKTPTPAPSAALVYADRVYKVEGERAVVQGFVLSGTVSLSGRLRTIPTQKGRTTLEVKGILVDGEQRESAGRGTMVRLSVKGAEAKELQGSALLDDGSLTLTQKLDFELTRNNFYKQEINGRDLHLQIPGALVPAHVLGEGDPYTAHLMSPVPVWDGMRLAVIDLDGKSPMGRALRVAGGGVAKVPLITNV
jgi:hypothetical protein